MNQIVLWSEARFTSAPFAFKRVITICFIIMLKIAMRKCIRVKGGVVLMQIQRIITKFAAPCSFSTSFTVNLSIQQITAATGSSTQCRFFKMQLYPSRMIEFPLRSQWRLLQERKVKVEVAYNHNHSTKSRFSGCQFRQNILCTRGESEKMLVSPHNSHHKTHS